MSENMFDKWDKSIDTKGLAEDIKQAEKDGANRTYKDVPTGDYEVAVQQMELKSSKAGDPMVSIWFKIVSDGEYKGSMLFMNQVITQGFQVHIVDEVLRGLVSECNNAPDIHFESYKQYANLILDVQEAINDKFEYALKYGQTKKGFPTFEITEVFVLD